MKGGQFLDQLNDCQILKEYVPRCNMGLNVRKKTWAKAIKINKIQ